MTFLGAGHETTASSTAWALHILSKNPPIQEQLRDEIRTMMPSLFSPARDDPATTAAMDPDLLPLLNNVCRETIRLYPVLPLVARQCIADDTIGPYHIPVGTTIHFFPNAVNYLSMYWGDDADEFKPERWNNLPKTWTKNAFLSFMQGQRGCIGRKFAEVEMKVLLCCLLSMFRFERDEAFADPDDMKVWIGVTKPRDGVNLRVSLL